MAIWNILQVFSIYILSGVWLTIFYKRDFEFKRHLICRIRYIIVLILVWGAVYSANIRVLTVLTSFGTLVYVRTELQALALEERIKCIALGFSLLITRVWEVEYLVCITVFCALTQLLRWPISLKNKLRESRIIFGPVYTIFAVGSWIRADLTSSLILTVAAILALVASILLRPDNNEVLKLLNCLGLPIPSQQCRKMAHGLCMFVSFVFCLVYIIILSQAGAIDSRVFYAICSIAAVNICMYICVADLPRKIIRKLLTVFRNEAEH
jgi:hypothetical protein